MHRATGSNLAPLCVMMYVLARKSRFICLVLVLSAVFCRPARSEQLILTQPDKQLHLAFSYGIAMTSAALFQKMFKTETRWEPALFAFTFTSMVGLLKEAMDPEPSGADFMADTIGAGSAALIYITLDF